MELVRAVVARSEHRPPDAGPDGQSNLILAAQIEIAKEGIAH